MTKRQKRLAKIRQNPKNVRFEELELILLELGFDKRQDGTSHVIFARGRYRLTIPKPHGTAFVKVVYIKKEFIPALYAMGVFDEE